MFNIAKILKIINLYNLSLRTNATYIPPVGSHYKTCVNLNFIGQQSINLYQIEKTKSYLVLKGIVNHNGYIYHTLNKNKIEKTYTLDETTINILNNYKCKIIDAKYIKEDDLCKIIITNYLLYTTKTIKLLRVND